MDEYEKMEAELKQIYEEYVIKYRYGLCIGTSKWSKKCFKIEQSGKPKLTSYLNLRCVAFLEQQLEEFERAEKDRAEERRLHTKKMLERMKQDDERLRSFEGTLTTGQGGAMMSNS